MKTNKWKIAQNVIKSHTQGLECNTFLSQVQAQLKSQPTATSTNPNIIFMYVLLHTYKRHFAMLQLHYLNEFPCFQMRAFSLSLSRFLHGIFLHCLQSMAGSLLSVDMVHWCADVLCICTMRIHTKFEHKERTKKNTAIEAKALERNFIVNFSRMKL